MLKESLDLGHNRLLEQKTESGVRVTLSEKFRCYIDSTSKQLWKNHAENSSIFYRFWKSNRCWVIHVEMMSSFPRGFTFHDRYTIVKKKKTILKYLDLIPWSVFCWYMPHISGGITVKTAYILHLSEMLLGYCTYM